MTWYSDSIDPVDGTSDLDVIYGPIEVYGAIIEDRGRESSSTRTKPGRTLMIAANDLMDDAPVLGGYVTVLDEDGREIPLSTGLSGVRPDNRTVAYWSATLKELDEIPTS